MRDLHDIKIKQRKKKREQQSAQLSSQTVQQLKIRGCPESEPGFDVLEKLRRKLGCQQHWKVSF